MSTRDERVSADIRRDRLAALGTLLYDNQRVHRIAAKMDPRAVGHGSDRPCVVCQSLKANT